MKLIGVHVDLTVCPSDEGWIEYLEYYNGFGDKIKIEGKLPYNLAELYPKVPNPLDYWRDLDYSQFWPIQGSVKSLKQLSKHFGIVFVSRTKGNHSKSKYYWLKDHFPFMTEYVSMHKKGVIEKAFECMIDDRLSVLSGFPWEKRVLFETNYTQDIKCECILTFNKWDEDTVEQICNLFL